MENDSHEVQYLKFRNAALRAMLGELEWIETNDDQGVWEFCPKCRQWRHEGHTPDCRLAALIREGEGKG